MEQLSTNRLSINDDDFYGMRPVYINGVSIIVCSVLLMLINHPFNLYMVKWGMEIRLVCCSMIYRKVRNAIALDFVHFIASVFRILDFTIVKSKRFRWF